MTTAGFLCLLPMMVVAATAAGGMLLIAARRSHALTAMFTVVGLATALGMIAVAARSIPQQVTPLLVIDSYALYYMALTIGAAAVVAAISYPFLRTHFDQPEEYYVLLCLAALGAATLVASDHFASFLLGLELLSVPLFAMIAYRRDAVGAVEGGVKYLVLAGASTAFLLMGMALVYAQSGTLQWSQMPHEWGSPLMLIGLGCLLVGIGFKLALVPFHMWTPDVYQAAPTPVAALVATMSKGAMFALLLRYFSHIDVRGSTSMFAVFSLLAVASMFTGNLLALLQTNIKRILAYSSIAHLGYLLIALLAGGQLAGVAVGFYLTAYFITMLGAFAVVAAVCGPDGRGEDVAEWSGLAWRRPGMAMVFTAMLLSLAGLPLTAGFIGKFYIIRAGAGSAMWGLLIVLVINSAMSLYYYLRVVAAMFKPSDEPSQTNSSDRPLPWLTGAVLCVLTALLFWLGVYPSPLLRLIQATGLL